MSEVVLHQINHIGFTKRSEQPAEHDRRLIDAWWLSNKERYPFQFNGKIVACYSHSKTALGLNIDWYTTTYAHYLLRTDPLVRCKAARALYCSVVIVTADGSLVVGEMSGNTSSPGRLQLPGGNVDGVQEGLELAACAETAWSELLEETGLCLNPSDLVVWLVKTGGGNEDVGILFRNRAKIDRSYVASTFESHQTRMRAEGTTPELERIHFLRGPRELDGLGRRYVDYLPAVFRQLQEHWP